MRRALAVLGAVLAAAAAGAPASSAAAPAAPYVVVYAPGVREPDRATDVRERSQGFHAVRRFRAAAPGFAAALTDAQAARLAADPAVRALSPDRPVAAAADDPPLAPLAPGESAPPGIRRIGAATASAAGPASSAGVAVLDTGIDLDHADLAVRPGRSCVAGAPTPDDDHGHGTHVAGTIAARNAGGGVVGVAPGTPVWAVKVLDASGRGAWSNLICGLDWAVATRTDADPGNDVDVVNLSISGTGDATDRAPCGGATSALHLAVCRATAAGITVVVSAGNAGRSFERAAAPDVPAAYPEALAVTAMTDTDGAPGGAGPAAACGTTQADDRFASYSDFATTPEGAAHVLAAPGSCVRSTARGGGTEVRSGTSMAAPHVAGLAALCLGTVGSGPGPCAGHTPAQTVATLRADAAARAAAAPLSGFAGDPARPVTGRVYGPLAWAAGTGAGGPGDAAPPAVTGLEPADGASGVAPTTTVRVTFSEPMDAAATAAALTLTGPGGTAVPAATAWSGTTLTLTPASPLTGGAAYVARVGTGARDVAGNALPAERTARFTVASTTPPAGPGAPLAPTSLAVGTGTNPRGTAADLAAVDGRTFALDSTTGLTPLTSWTATFTAVPATAATLAVAHTGGETQPCTRTLAFLRWRDGAWVAPAADGSAPTADVRAPSGEVRVRVRCTGSLRAFTASSDALLLSVRG